MAIPENILKLHEALVEFSSRVQGESEKKKETESHVGTLVHIAFYKMAAYAVTLHRSILTLCEAGWTHVSPILLRTIMECSANCLAIINNDLPEYMAFKYLYHPYIQILRDEGYPEDRRAKAKSDIEAGIENLKDEKVKEKVRQYIDIGRIDIFWFKPEESGISLIIEKYGSKELGFTYGAYSMSAHAGHLGMFLLKDNPDDIKINPAENPIKTKVALVSSCRWLLELLYIRNSYEGLGFDSEYGIFLEKILATEGEVRT